MEITREEFEKLKKESFFRGRIVSPSMSPVIKLGDQITVDVGAPNLKRFDIIVFYENGKLICHYLWSINRIIKPVLFQARNLGGGKDFPCKEENYLGRVVSHQLGFWHKVKAFL